MGTDKLELPECKLHECATNDTEDKTNSTSIRLIILEKWIPALITAGIGGLLVALLAPGIQSNFAEESALKKRKIEVWESIGLNFTQFINSNFQLVSVAREIEAQQLKKLTPPPALFSRLDEYRQARDTAASKLNGDLVIATFYFDESTSTLLKSYRRWVVSIANSTIDTMPARSEFEGWRDKFVVNLGKQIDVK